ncbi:MAG: glycoside hydrolase family 27 protein [Cyanosarcina radialis HA8281-LM2]|nr:glycoside hydrolase family 27 protein [Cyanosarcina radialis HA8281-LM2]
MDYSSKPLAATPPMGWNSWNMFGSNIDEALIRETADAIVSSGLKDCGYEYIVIDDCWSQKDRRDAHGDLMPDPTKFPSGMKALADYVHSRGLKIGIYSDAAELTCAGYIGSYGFEERDAQLWASWGMDFLKYDYCYAPSDRESAIERYDRMGAALQKTGREFLYSLCEWGGRSPHLWGRKVGGQMWRVSRDVLDRWEDIEMGMDIAADLHDYSGPGGWNDLDMLVVGLNGSGQIAGEGLSFAEYQTHISMWCMACSPLMIGCDVRKLDRETAALLMNREVIAVNQDVLGRPAQRSIQSGQCEIWKKLLGDGTVAVALVNRGLSDCDIILKSSDIGLPDKPKLARNLWLQQDIADFTIELTQHVRSHETILLKVEGANPLPS